MVILEPKKQNLNLNRDWCKKSEWVKIWPLDENSQFLSNQGYVQAILPAY